MLVLRQHSNLLSIRLALNLLIAVYDHDLPSRTRPRALSFVYLQNLKNVLGFLVQSQDEALYLYCSPLLLLACAIGLCAATAQRIRAKAND